MIDSFSDVLVVHLLLLLIVPKVTPQYESSPCPRVFNYQYDQQRGLYGVVRVVHNHNTRLQLNIEMSVGNSVQGYNGHIELLKPKDEVIQDIINYRPILYKLFFPYWRRIPPQITKISVNGDLICSGPKIPRNLVPVITTINLQHTMKVDVLPLSLANGPEGNSVFHPEDEAPGSKFDGFDHRREYGENFRTSRNRPPPPPPDGPPPDGPPPGRPPPPPPPPQYNPGRPVEMPNNGGNPFQETDSANENPSDGILKLNPNNPFFFKPTKDRSEEDSPKPNKETTQSTLDAPTPPISQRDPVRATSSDVSPVSVEFALADSLRTGTPYENICGKSVSTNALVLHGHEVPRGAYPWLVALFGVKPTGLNYMCSGSLISGRHVVTAAHCAKKEKKVLQPSDLLVILGKLNIQKWVPSDGEKMVEPESIHIHPDYMEFSGDADVAVLVLSEKIEFTKYIRPLCLWSGDSELEKIVGKQGTVVGWGKDEKGNLMTEEPKQIQLPVVSQETCLRSSYQFIYITSNRTFCAGFRNGTGPCNGDSGSGFIMQHEGRWMLRGVVSTSISDNRERTCDLKNYVVFTDVSKFYDWFLSFIK